MTWAQRPKEFQRQERGGVIASWTKTSCGELSEKLPRALLRSAKLMSLDLILETGRSVEGLCLTA